MDKGRVLVAGLAGSEDFPFISGELFEPHGAAGVEFLGGNADFCAQAKFAAVGEGRGGVGVNGRGVDKFHEVVNFSLILGNNGLAVFGAIFTDVIDCFF